LLLSLGGQDLCRDHYRQTSSGANVKPARDSKQTFRSGFTLAAVVAG
jgi:hypothetical protein